MSRKRLQAPILTLTKAVTVAVAVAVASFTASLVGGCDSKGQDPATKAPVAANSGTPASPSVPNAPAASAKKVRIGVSVPAAEHGWGAGVSWWAKRAMALYPDIQWTFITANSPEKQIADIEDMLVKGIDGLVILATESAPLTPAAERAKERGIFIVNVDRGFLKPVADVFLEGDNEAFGQRAAQFIVERLGGEQAKGNILVLEGIPSTVNTARVSAAAAVFKAHPGVKILGQQPGMWNRQKALEVTQAMLVKNPDVQGIWAADDDMALGAEQALKEANRKNVWIVGGGGSKDIVKRILDKDPMFPATITYPPSMIAAGVHTAASALRDGKRDKIAEFLPRHVRLDVELVTPANASRFYFPDSVY